jgi:pimeloyl-ACP methyl ester carboxylesterase
VKRFDLTAVFLAAAVWGAHVPADAEGRQPPGRDRAYQVFSRPRLAVLPDGRKIALHCVGHGAPTIVLTAGAAEWAETWRTIVAPLSLHARVCAWDRAGFGFSSASTEPQDVVHTERDLEHALRAGLVTPPYVMVGHSLGAYEALLFADRHPAEVKAMVLVDPSFPDQDRTVRKTHPEAEAFMDRSMAELTASQRRCAEALRAGAIRPGAPDPDGCLTLPAQYPKDLSATLEALYMDPDRALTRTSFDDNVARDAELVINPGRGYGAMPLIVLTAAHDLPSSASMPRSVRDFLSTDWVAGHDALAALSSRGSNRMVRKTSHYIHVLKPESVINAVTEVLAEVRRTQQLPPH